MISPKAPRPWGHGPPQTRTAPARNRSKIGPYPAGEGADGETPGLQRTTQPTTSPCRPGPPTRRSLHFPYGPTCTDAGSGDPAYITHPSCPAAQGTDGDTPGLPEKGQFLILYNLRLTFSGDTRDDSDNRAGNTYRTIQEPASSSGIIITVGG